jgi:hypothetical protein
MHATPVKPSRKVNYDIVRRVALTFPNVEESTSYGTPALKVKGKLFVRLREDNQTIVLRMESHQREEMMADDPETYFITDHYREYPWVLARLAKLRSEALRDLLQVAYRNALAGTRKPNVRFR